MIITSTLNLKLRHKGQEEIKMQAKIRTYMDFVLEQSQPSSTV